MSDPAHEEGLLRACCLGIPGGQNQPGIGIRRVRIVQELGAGNGPGLRLPEETSRSAAGSELPEKRPEIGNVPEAADIRRVPKNPVHRLCRLREEPAVCMVQRLCLELSRLPAPSEGRPGGDPAKAEGGVIGGICRLQKGKGLPPLSQQGEGLLQHGPHDALPPAGSVCRHRYNIGKTALLVENPDAVGVQAQHAKGNPPRRKPAEHGVVRHLFPIVKVCESRPVLRKAALVQGPGQPLLPLAQYPDSLIRPGSPEGFLSQGERSVPAAHCSIPTANCFVPAVHCSVSGSHFCRTRYFLSYPDGK